MTIIGAECLSQPMQSGLTDEQRKLIAQKKEIAIARRLAKEKVSAVELATSQPRTLQTSDGPRVFSDYNSQRNGEADALNWRDGCEGHNKHLMSGPQSPVFSGCGTGLKRDSEQRDEDNGGDQGWRSIRKRRVPGLSFGREIGEPLLEVDDKFDKASIVGWKRERREGNDGGAAAQPRGPQIPQPQATKLDWQKPPPKVNPKPSEQQMQVLNAIRNGKSVFFTGSAGTGKSFVLRFAIRLLKIIHGGDGVYVTASTGLAACALGGTTLHSFAGLGLGSGKKESLVEKVKSRRESRHRWVNAKALIVDEISMIDGEFFDKLDYVGRIVRNRSQPFGGIQLIVTGDFYQLPPVHPPNPDKYFAFEADCWNSCFDLQIELTAVFRQSDEEFVGMLNKIRRGVCPPSVHQRLRNCLAPVDDDSGVVLSRLYPRKMDVGRENEQNLRALGQPTVVYRAKDEARNEFSKKQLDNVTVDAVLCVCIGAQVMLAKNLETGMGLVNGARGVIVGFTSPDDPRAAEVQKTARSVNPSGMWPIVRFVGDNLDRMVGPESWSITEGDVEVAKRTQVPLLLAWALSVHKCQGMTLDRVETDLSRAFDYGMVYVALSRVRSLEGLRLIGFDPSKIRVHPKVAKFYDKMKNVIDLSLDEG